MTDFVTQSQKLSIFFYNFHLFCKFSLIFMNMQIRSLGVGGGGGGGSQ